MADPEIEAERAKVGIKAVLANNNDLHGSVKINFNTGVALNMNVEQRIFLAKEKKEQ